MEIKRTKNLPLLACVISLATMAGTTAMAAETIVRVNRIDHGQTAANSSKWDGAWIAATEVNTGAQRNFYTLNPVYADFVTQAYLSGVAIRVVTPTAGTGRITGVRLGR